MKVLMLSWEFPPSVVGGLGIHVVELVSALGHLGVQVHLVAPRVNGGAEKEPLACALGTDSPLDGSFVYRVDPTNPGDGNFYDRTIRWNQDLRARAQRVIDEVGGFDLIHVHDWLPGAAAIALKNANRLPLLTTIHATEYGRVRGTFWEDMQLAIHNAEWWLSYEAWRIICCSQFMSGEVQTAFRVPSDKIDVVPNGVDTRRFDALRSEDLSAFRAGFAAPDEKLLFNVGRLVWEKGANFLVEAMPKVLDHIPNTRLVIAGTGPASDWVRQRAVDLGVTSHCNFVGFVDDAVRDRLFCVADVAVFPSLYEPFGIVVLEAMAARAPVVASEVGGFAEVIRHGENGITVYPANVDSLVWGIDHTLDHPEWAQQRVENAYREARDQYNWDAIAARTKRVYRRVVEERQRTVWQ